MPPYSCKPRLTRHQRQRWYKPDATSNATTPKISEQRFCWCAGVGLPTHNHLFPLEKPSFPCWKFSCVNIANLREVSEYGFRGAALTDMKLCWTSQGQLLHQEEEEELQLSSLRWFHEDPPLSDAAALLLSPFHRKRHGSRWHHQHHPQRCQLPPLCPLLPPLHLHLKNWLQHIFWLRAARLLICKHVCVCVCVCVFHSGCQFWHARL